MSTKTRVDLVQVSTGATIQTDIGDIAEDVARRIADLTGTDIRDYTLVEVLVCSACNRELSKPHTRNCPAVHVSADPKL